MRRLDLALLAALAVATLFTLGAREALANHVKCGDIIRHNTKLDSDLLDCPGDGIVIGRDHLTLDLNGHTIAGAKGGSIIANEWQAACVQNGGTFSVRNFPPLIPVEYVCQPVSSDVEENVLLPICFSYPDALGARWFADGQLAFCERSGAVPTGTGLDNSAGHSRVAIENGTIRSFAVGISFKGADNGLVSRVGGFNTTGIVLSESDENRIVGGSIGSLVLSESDENRIVGSGPKISLDNSNANQIVGNLLNEVRLAHGSANNLIQDNHVVVDFDGPAIEVRSSPNNLIERNFLGLGERTAGGPGVLVSDSAGVRVSENVLTNLYTGMVVSGSDDARVEGNQLLYGGPYDHGDDSCRICIMSSSNAQISHNVASRSPGYGIVVDGASIAPLLEDNETSENYRDGIVVFNGARPTLLGNVANDNGADGIRVLLAYSLLKDNHADRNANLGIEAVHGVTDGGGNTAFGNGNPLQCLNVECK